MISEKVTDTKTTYAAGQGVTAAETETEGQAAGETLLQKSSEPVTAQVPNLYLYPPCPPELAKPTFRAPIAR